MATWALKVLFFSYGKKIKIALIAFSCSALDSPLKVDKHFWKMQWHKVNIKNVTSNQRYLHGFSSYI